MEEGLLRLFYVACRVTDEGNERPTADVQQILNKDTVHAFL
jgi:hypothetical protein